MDKGNLELFKQALNEGVSNKFDKMAAECTEEIVYSDRHKITMRTIVYGKADTKRVRSPKMKLIVAILVTVALLLTSCGIIFRNQIREIFKEFFVSLTYEGDEESQQTIQEVYYLSYVPEGYKLEKERITSMRVKYEFVNETRDALCFEQRTLTLSNYYIDSESGYSKIESIDEYDIYYRPEEHYHCYIWNDGKYSMKLISNEKLSKEDIVLILDGIITK